MNIRYALFEDNAPPTPFNDSPVNLQAVIEHGARAISVHAYSQSLEETRRPDRIWGDVHTFFDLPVGVSTNERLSELNRFLVDCQIPLADVALYRVMDGVELVIKERCFRGEVGSPCRPQFDHYVQGRCNATPMLYRNINGQHVEFGHVLNPDRQALDKTLYIPGLHATGVSMLSERYYYFHNQLAGRKDLLTPKIAMTSRCSVLGALLNSSVVTAREYAAVASLFQPRTSILRGVLSLLGKGDLESKIDAGELNRAKKEYPPASCVQAPRIVSELGNKYSCKGCCGVTSPAALPFLPWDTPQGAQIGRTFGGCSLDKEGLYLFDEQNGKSTKIMEPIWVHQSLQGENKEQGGREVVCCDAHGFQKRLNISEADLDSPRLFAILRSNRVHVPISKTEQGKIREYLVSQFPTNIPIQVAASSNGWQQDGSHIDPSGKNLNPKSVYRLKARALAKGDYVTPSSINVDSTTTDRSILLAILASMAGAALKHLHRRGVCIHFYGSTEESRKALLLSASSAWGGQVYSFDDAKKHVRDLKLQYSDSAVCIGGISASQVRSMRSFVKRYFLGRKGADEGVTGVIISTGEQPLAQSKNRQKGVHAFTVNNEVLAIDIPIRSMNESACDVKGLASSLVSELSSNFHDTRGCLCEDQVRFVYQYQRAQKGKGNKAVADLLWLFAAVGSWAYGEKLLGWWQGNSIHIVFEDIVKAVDGQEDLFLGYLKRISLPVPSEAAIGSLKVKYQASLVDIGHGRVLVPSEWLKTVIESRSVLEEFLKWLRANRVLITQGGKSCGIYHNPLTHKSQRGYALWEKSIDRITKGYS